MLARQMEQRGTTTRYAMRDDKDVTDVTDHHYFTPCFKRDIQEKAKKCLSRSSACDPSKVAGTPTADPQSARRAWID
jgi:hypothetical protein